MEHEITLKFSEALIRRVVRRYWFRTLGLRYFLALILLGVAFAVMLSGGSASWIVGVFGAVLFIGIAMAVRTYFFLMAALLRRFRALDGGQGAFRADDASFTISAAASSSTMPWSNIKELWLLPDAWLLIYGTWQFNTLPLAYLTPEVQVLIQERALSAGAKLVRLSRKSQPLPG